MAITPTTSPAETTRPLTGVEEGLTLVGRMTGAVAVSVEAAVVRHLASADPERAGAELPRAAEEPLRRMLGGEVVHFVPPQGGHVWSVSRF
ncbi:hypothetical protein [Streptomyces sp. NPDC002067]